MVRRRGTLPSRSHGNPHRNCRTPTPLARRVHDQRRGARHRLHRVDPAGALSGGRRPRPRRRDSDGRCRARGHRRDRHAARRDVLRQPAAAPPGGGARQRPGPRRRPARGVGGDRACRDGAPAGAPGTRLRRAHLAARGPARPDVLPGRARHQPALGAGRVRPAQPTQCRRSHHDGGRDRRHRRLARLGRRGRSGGHRAHVAGADDGRFARPRAQRRRTLATGGSGVAALRRAHPGRRDAQHPQRALRRAGALRLRAAGHCRLLCDRSDRGRARAAVPERDGLRAARAGRLGRRPRRLALGRRAATQRNARRGLRARSVRRRAAHDPVRVRPRLPLGARAVLHPAARHVVPGGGRPGRGRARGPRAARPLVDPGGRRGRHHDRPRPPAHPALRGRRRGDRVGLRVRLLRHGEHRHGRAAGRRACALAAVREPRRAAWAA